MIRDDLWAKHDIEWSDHGRQALARVVHAEQLPFVELHPPDEDGELYFGEGIDEAAEAMYIERSYAKPLPLTNKDLLQIARELNEWCRERGINDTHA